MVLCTEKSQTVLSFPPQLTVSIAGKNVCLQESTVAKALAVPLYEVDRLQLKAPKMLYLNKCPHAHKRALVKNTGRCLRKGFVYEHQ